ncbi:type II secretion system ATPase GspE [bacterium]|nr:type II secretion system ATPase GspE [bacterium]MBU4561740.1 type II secretion system ATPase GspE [bacterium]MCG2675838.1 type II secretion system ATPase GspE [bacterium]MCG2677986.1 type II secretion system ATPase GspE [bacterium]
MVEARQRTLERILTSSGLLTREQLNTALEEQRKEKGRLEKVIIRLKLATHDQILDLVAAQLGMKRIKLEDYKFSEEALKAIPARTAHLYRMIPIKKTKKTLTVAMADPFDIRSLDDLSLLLDCKVEGMVAPEDEVMKAIEKNYGLVEESVEEMVAGMDEELEVIHEEEGAEELEEIADEAPIIKLVSLIILQALKERVSDIHLEPFEKTFKIRYRIDGVLHEKTPPPKRFQAAMLSRLKIMAGMNIAERRLPQDGRIMLRMLGRDIDLRVSSFPSLFGESIVMRILDKSSVMLGLAEVGFLSDSEELFNSLIKRPNGIMLVTGPTGSGKTTTLYAALNKINTADVKIITVEDPVEYHISGINQTQVKPNIGLTFARCLRSILRQAPNIIMIGEIRDVETAEIAIRASLTGHLVFSTLHTNDAPSAVTRLMDMGVKPFLVSSSVAGVMAQRLVRTICSECREAYEPSTKDLLLLNKKKEDLKDGKLYRGKGCSACTHTGYRKRTGIFEVMPVTDRIRDLILEKAPAATVKTRAREEGMRTMREDGFLKVALGQTTIDEVLRVTQSDIE